MHGRITDLLKAWCKNDLGVAKIKLKMNSNELCAFGQEKETNE